MIERNLLFLTIRPLQDEASRIQFGYRRQRLHLVAAQDNQHQKMRVPCIGDAVDETLVDSFLRSLEPVAFVRAFWSANDEHGRIRFGMVSCR